MLDDLISNAHEVVIICMPVWYSPKPSPEQSNCLVEQCPECNIDMWVSERKRAIRDKAKVDGSYNVKVLCGMCAVKHKILSERDGATTITDVDISKFE